MKKRKNKKASISGMEAEKKMFYYHRMFCASTVFGIIMFIMSIVSICINFALLD